MTLITLTAQEREGLNDLAARTLQASELRWAQALLGLDAGESVPEVAGRLRVTRQTIYNWTKRFQVQSPLDVPARLATSHRTGRPRTAQGIIEPLILEVIARDPRELGYRSTVWTAPLLAYYLEQQHHLKVSRKSVSLAIGRLELRWKRPRHDLARRPTAWRQAKGGSNGAWPYGSAPSS
jgi:transposase